MTGTGGGTEDGGTVGTPEAGDPRSATCGIPRIQLGETSRLFVIHGALGDLSHEVTAKFNRRAWDPERMVPSPALKDLAPRTKVAIGHDVIHAHVEIDKAT